MKLALLLLFIPSLSFGAVKAVTGEYDDKDTAVINRAFKELQQGQSITTLRNKFRIKVGTFTSKASTGSQSVTGIGFKPRAIIFAMGVGAADSIVAALGWSDGTSQSAAFGFRSDDTNTGGLSTDTSTVIRWTSVAGVAVGQASLTSLDLDGFTLNWSAADARVITYFAFE